MAQEQRSPAVPEQRSGRGEPLLDAGELEILRHLGQGKPLAAIARELQLSERTIRRRTRRVCEHVGVETPIEAVVWAVRRRLL